MILKYARDKIRVDKIILHLSGGKEENKVAMSQYLSKYLFDKYEDEENVAASKCGLPVSNSMKLEPVAAMVYDTNITLTSLIII